MTNYVNPSTRIGGVEQIIVASRQTVVRVDDAPFDDIQYVRVNGEWVPVDFPVIVRDTLAPSSPTSLSSTSTINGSRIDYELAWVAPTTNTDATPLTDFGYYVVRWRYVGYGGGLGAWASFVSNDPAALLPDLAQGIGIEWEVLARDISGNDSAWATGGH
jgi:hypothetical protein